MNYEKVCFDIYWKAQGIIAPNLIYSQDIYAEFLFSQTINVNNWLELGCGHQLLPSWRKEQEKIITSRPNLLIGLDCNYNSLRKNISISNLIQGEISNLPFKPETFDLVTSNMVFEHLSNPENQLREIFRVLKPGGILIFHTPNINSYLHIINCLVPNKIRKKLIWYLEHRKEEDTFKTYYRINTKNRILKLARNAGFEVDKIRLICSSAQFIMIPPFVLCELLLLRILLLPIGRNLRPNIITMLKRPNRLCPNNSKLLRTDKGI